MPALKKGEFMKLKNIEVKFDFLDADDIERFEKAAKKVTEKCKEKEEEKLSMSEAIKEECMIIENFFNEVFGEGISQKLFEGRKNLTEHMEIFKEIIKAKQEKQADLQETFNRYKPNREQRRYEKYHGNKR